MAERHARVVEGDHPGREAVLERVEPVRRELVQEPCLGAWRDGRHRIEERARGLGEAGERASTASRSVSGICVPPEPRISTTKNGLPAVFRYSSAGSTPCGSASCDDERRARAARA